MVRTTIRWVLIPIVLIALLLVLIRLIVVKPPTIEIQREAIQTEHYSMTIQWSRLISANAKDSARYAAYDRVMQGRILELKSEFLENVDALQALLDSMPEVDRPEWRSELYITDTVFTASRDLVSVRLNAYQYTGGAHGMTSFEAMNFNMNQLRLLTIDDLIDPKEYSKVDKLMKQSFENKDQCFIDDPKMELLPIVNVAPKGVVFLFPQYILGPYCCGAAEIYVPSKGFLK